MNLFNSQLIKSILLRLEIVMNIRLERYLDISLHIKVTNVAQIMTILHYVTYKYIQL